MKTQQQHVSSESWDSFPSQTTLNASLFLFQPSSFFSLMAGETFSVPVMAPNPLVSFLERVQEAALHTYGGSNFDPKLYVDFSLKLNLSETTQAFDKLLNIGNGSISIKDFDQFIGKYFEGAGDDLVYAQPVDFVPEPQGFLSKVENPEVRAWALEVHALWKNLSRKLSGSVQEQPQLHTLLPLPRPVIIPGSRFREVYYWDSYWVIRGLLVSKMYETANAIVMNLISLIDSYGYVLNGARAYYTNRSQPPLLSAMVREIYNRTGDTELIKKAVPALLKEYQFWSSGIHEVSIHDDEQNKYCLNRYYAMWDKPRPESSTLDKESASKISDLSEKQQFYRELASAAESGWDFSTRWMRDGSEFTTLATTSVLPVDLNVFILRMELDIAFFARVTGADTIAKSFTEASQARQRAINSVFWNDSMGQWLDYWTSNGTTCKASQTFESKNQSQRIFASNFVPLWIDLFNSDTPLVEKVMRSLHTSGLVCAGGIATSLTNSGQQWDYPNGWAPLQHMIVEGLAKSGSTEARSMAKDIAQKWIRANYAAFQKTGVMHEKYDVEKCGEHGGGGEYAPQTGFGWSNGVVLAFLEEFGWPRHQKVDCD